MASLPELFSLQGRSAIVTGGVGLLGRQFCRTLAEAGAQVAVVDKAGGPARAFADELSAQGYSALAVETDITDKASVTAMAQTVVAEFGAIDILVNSAALDPKFSPGQISAQGENAFEDFPLEAWQRSLDVNLTGLFLVTQAAVQPMLANQRGVIVNLCSMYGIAAPDQRLYQREGQPPLFKPVTYSTAKAGVLGFTRYLAAYYGDRDIRVNALTPGGVFNDHDEQFLQRYNARAVLGRMAQPDEMNGALLFLASDASSYMTGANLVVDGGWTAW
jgi:2-deoxy-D-gluconate 3-dehydrogenase